MDTPWSLGALMRGDWALYTALA